MYRSNSTSRTGRPRNHRMQRETSGKKRLVQEGCCSVRRTREKSGCSRRREQRRETRWPCRGRNRGRCLRNRKGRRQCSRKKAREGGGSQSGGGVNRQREWPQRSRRIQSASSRSARCGMILNCQGVFNGN